MADTDDISALLGQLAFVFGSGAEESAQKEESGAEGIFGDIDLETIMKLMEAFSKVSGSDKNTELLLALKPHLKNENRSKVDKAIKLMKLMSIFLMLRESGLLNSLY